MAHLLFDNLSSVSVDNQSSLTVQSLLDSQSLSSEAIPGATVVTTRPPTAITLDEEDVFQCGKCKKQFTSFTLFMCHKKEHAVADEQQQLAGSQMKQTVEGNLTLALDAVQQDHNRYSQDREAEVGQPIILSDTDILSFNIDSGALNISTGSPVLSPLSHVIQNGTFLASPSEAASSLKTSGLNVTTLDTQPIILTDGSFMTQDGVPQTEQRGSNVIEYTSDVGRNFQFVEVEPTPNGVELHAPDIVTQTSSSAPNSNILLETIEEQQPDKSEESGDKERASKNLKLKCRYCSKLFAKNFDLQQHMRSHTGEKPFQCVICGRAFSQKSNVKKHMATHKVWPMGLNCTLPKEPLQAVAKKDFASCDKGSGSSTEVELLVDRAYVCQYCNTRFDSYFELKTHMKQHSHQKVYKCIQKNCQQTFSDLELFVNHRRLHSSEVLYRCHVCSKQFHRLSDLGMHQYSHNAKSAPAKVNSRVYRCIKCKSQFSSPEALDHHMAVSTHSYPCPHCGKIFACERYLRRHLPTHGTAKSFMCPQCGKGFRTEQYLNTHKLTHSSHKPYVCQHCPAAFNRKDKLVRHLLIHQSVKKFKCPFRVYLGCPKEFNRADKLKLHILTHSSVRPSLQCRICNKTFQRQSQLRQHDRTHHQAAPHTCQTCGMGFKKKISLVSHECKSASEQQKDSNAHNDSLGKPQSRARRCVRKNKLKVRSKSDVPAVGVTTNDSKTGDNVPTIEIIVMPLSIEHSASSETPHSGSPVEQGSMYHVVFPAESKIQTVFSTSDDAALSQCNQPQDQEVPVASTSL